MDTILAPPPRAVERQGGTFFVRAQGGDDTCCKPITEQATMATIGPFARADQLLAHAARDPALRRQDLARRVLTLLAHNAATKGVCWRSLRKLADELGSCRGSVRRVLRRLANAGYLTMVRPIGQRIYHFFLPIDRALARPATPAPAPAAHFGARPRADASGRAGGPDASGRADAPTLRGAPPSPPEPSEPSGNHRNRPDEVGSARGKPEPASAAHEPVPPGEGGGVESWVGYALEMAESSGSSSAATAAAVERSATVIAGRLSSAAVAVIAGPLWESIRRPGRSWILLDAARRADRSLSCGQSSLEAGRQFGARWRGQLLPQPVRADSEAASARREEAQGRSRRRSSEPRSSVGLMGLLRSGVADGESVVRRRSPEEEIKKLKAWRLRQSQAKNSGGRGPT